MIYYDVITSKKCVNINACKCVQDVFNPIYEFTIYYIKMYRFSVQVSFFICDIDELNKTMHIIFILHIHIYAFKL